MEQHLDSGAAYNQAKETLAYELTALVHGKEEADKQLAAAKAIFADMEQARASKENQDWTAFLLTKAVVYLIGHDHRADVYGIISAMTGKTAEQIESQKITATIADVQEFADKDFRDFLAQSLAGGKSA
jgi:tyrosyl-tRNA synthetase